MADNPFVIGDRVYLNRSWFAPPASIAAGQIGTVEAIEPRRVVIRFGEDVYVNVPVSIVKLARKAVQDAS